jgi:hypothetical protein
MITLNTRALTIAVAGLLVGAFGSGCAVRSPEMYRDDTTKVLETKTGEIRACYDEILKGSPTATGKVTVTFEVETEAGKIQNVAIDRANSTAPDALSQCVKKSIEGLVVAPPDKRTGQATYVYDFTIPSTPKS